MAQAEQLAYHRKYRPHNLVGYVGNEKLKATVINSLAKPIRPQVMLLEGASGCGKTTMARIIAKEYSCENRDDIMGACGSCPSCQEVEEYIHTGDTDMLQYIREIDIADNSGKKDLDSVFEEMMLPTYGDQWRIYIFDECHMATPQAQNRMLKVAEEPPEHVLMIFCTTDPDMMIETLVNRCQLRLHVKKPTVGDLAGLLKRVCSAEQVDYDVKGLNFIANRSELTIRKALTSLEQVINEQGSAKYDNAIKVFEEVSDKVIIDFYRKLLPNNDGKRDVTGYITLLHNIKTQTELPAFVTSLIDFTRRGVYIMNQVQLEGVSDGELSAYRELFSRFSVEQMASLITKLADLQGRNIEIKLILMGYTGLLDYQTSVTVDPTRSDSHIKTLDSELGQEKKQAVVNRETKKGDQLKLGQQRAEDLTQDCPIDVIQSLFGCPDVIVSQD